MSEEEEFPCEEDATVEDDTEDLEAYYRQELHLTPWQRCLNDRFEVMLAFSIITCLCVTGMLLFMFWQMWTSITG